MRSVLWFVVVGMSLSTAHADPFAVRNPLPPTTRTDEPSEDSPDVSVLDPGKSQRHTGAWVAAGGGAMLAASGALSFYMRSRYDAALDRVQSGDNLRGAIAEADHARNTARVWGTTLFAGGLAAIGVGAYLYFTAPIKIRRERVSVVPSIESDGVGITLTGGF